MQKKILYIFLLGLVLLPQRVFAQSRQVPIIAAEASSSLSLNPPSAAFDNDLTTLWKAENGPPQWILLDLGQPYTLSKIVLHNAQSVSGRAVHTLYAGASPDQLSRIISLDQMFVQSQVITVPFLQPLPNTRYIRIETEYRIGNLPSWREIEIYEGSTSESKLQYFGYLSQEGKFADRITDEYFTQLDSLGNTNVAWVYGDVENLRRFSEHGIKALIRAPIDEVFFTTSGTLRTDWQQRWNAWRASIAGYEDTILGFEFDEPNLVNTISKDAFVTATRAIRIAYPMKAILVIEFAGAVDNIPEGYYQYVTDVAFDYYFTRNTEANNFTGWGNYLEFLERYKQYPPMRSKRFWVIPDGQGDPGTQTRWPDAFERYLSLVQTTDNGVGLLSFQYNAGPTYNGVNLGRVLNPGPYFMEEYRTRHVEVGKAILGLSGNGNNNVFTDGKGYIIWLTNYLQNLSGGVFGDFDNNGTVNAADYLHWLSSYGN